MSNKRHFTVIYNKKENGLYQGRSPSSVAKKVVSKLSGGKKIVFHLRETTQNSKKKIYGPYEGIKKRLDEVVKIGGRVYKHESIVKKLESRGGATVPEINENIGKIKIARNHVTEMNDLIKSYKIVNNEEEGNTTPKTTTPIASTPQTVPQLKRSLTVKGSEGPVEIASLNLNRTKKPAIGQYVEYKKNNQTMIGQISEISGDTIKIKGKNNKIVNSTIKNIKFLSNNEIPVTSNNSPLSSPIASPLSTSESSNNEQLKVYTPKVIQKQMPSLGQKVKITKNGKNMEVEVKGTGKNNNKNYFTYIYENNSGKLREGKVYQNDNFEILQKTLASPPTPVGNQQRQNKSEVMIVNNNSNEQNIPEEIEGEEEEEISSILIPARNQTRINVLSSPPRSPNDSSVPVQKQLFTRTSSFDPQKERVETTKFITNEIRRLKPIIITRMGNKPNLKNGDIKATLNQILTEEGKTLSNRFKNIVVRAVKDTSRKQLNKAPTQPWVGKTKPSQISQPPVLTPNKVKTQVKNIMQSNAYRQALEKWAKQENQPNTSRNNQSLKLENAG